MNVVSRAAWGARGVQSRYGKMHLPATAVYLHHSVSPVSKDPHADMRRVEATGMKRFGQFSYSYCAHPDGTILEGAGRLIGAHTKRRNSTSFGIALIGNYENRGVTVWQIDAVRWLIDRLIDDGDLVPGIYPTGGHRDVIDPDTGKPTATACPGDKAYRLLDAFRVPWSEQPAAQGDVIVPDDQNLPNITGPVTYTFIVTADGIVRGYYCWSATTAELHAHGEIPYFGRSEVVS